MATRDMRLDRLYQNRTKDVASLRTWDIDGMTLLTKVLAVKLRLESEGWSDRVFKPIIRALLNNLSRYSSRTSTTL